MNIIKLNAIDSTNSYLKKLAKINAIESFTVVVSNQQTAGRGQMGTNWIADSGKNLTFSILIKFNNFEIKHQFYLSMAVSLGILGVLKKSVNVPFAIKWPNDILAEKDKISGVLIENILSGNFIKQSIIGIGLNVNQELFPNSIGNATSLKNITGIDFNIDTLLKSIVNSIKFYAKYVEKMEFEKLKKLYIDSLYKYQKSAMFEDNESVFFLGKIIDINEDGRLVVELENETTRTFNFKEIKFASR